MQLNPDKPYIKSNHNLGVSSGDSEVSQDKIPSLAPEEMIIPEISIDKSSDHSSSDQEEEEQVEEEKEEEETVPQTEAQIEKVTREKPRIAEKVVKKLLAPK